MKTTLRSLFFLAVTVLCARADLSQYEIKPDVVYGHKMGMALTYDTVKPKAKANGAGVLFMVSGGWVSSYIPPEKALSGDFNEALGFTKLLDKGFTLFFVRHGSSPRFLVPDAVDDVRKAVRHVRSQAAEMGLDPKRLGVFGASAGGHLSLMLGTTGDDGQAEAKDALGKTANRVAAVVAIYSPSELKSYQESEKMRKDFPALTFDTAKVDEVSPIKQVTADDAPTLLLHGGKDELVPDQHSKDMHKAFQEKGVATDIVLFPNAGHAFVDADCEQAVASTVAWFEKHLIPKAEAAAASALAGEWALEVTFGDDEPRDYTLKIADEKGSLKGIFVSPRSGEFPVESLKLEGTDFQMKLKRDFNGTEVTMLYTGKLENGALTGKVAAEGFEDQGAGEWKGKKK